MPNRFKVQLPSGIIKNPKLIVAGVDFSPRSENALAQAIGNMEPPDPILPSVWLRSLVHGPSTSEVTTDHDLLDTGLNLAIIVFLGWLGVILLRRPPR